MELSLDNCASKPLRAAVDQLETCISALSSDPPRLKEASEGACWLQFWAAGNDCLILHNKVLWVRDQGAKLLEEEREATRRAHADGDAKTVKEARNWRPSRETVGAMRAMAKLALLDAKRLARESKPGRE
ncbi:hypothetical protein G6O67_008636 [Ophiocordyceps sinensis]|uniref:Uncharacterized protein n=2 Tax=Ophiocordyceps sinensis TaxID=72228 RepID=A0A8H4LRD3_9HYPO|nr:hypothetical protein OCS_02595 [Ophiocordyceps sinensis CO18]KAF4504014.1 hypothetical protein G6O67_008636 [Ophiocordyceps sinensis]